MNLEIITLSDVSQRQIPYDIIYMWNLKKMIQMNLLTKQEQTHRPWKQTYGYWRGKAVGRDKLGVWDYHISSTIYVIDNQGPTV